MLYDLKEDLLDKLNLLRDVFTSNAYPAKTVNTTINVCWSIELKKALMEAATKVNDSENDEYFNVLSFTIHSRLFRKTQKNIEEIRNWVCHEARRDCKNKALQTKSKVR